MNLYAVYHPKKTTVLPTPDNQYALIENSVSPESGNDRSGHQVNWLIAGDDEKYYRSSMSEFMNISLDDYEDHLDVRFALEPDENNRYYLLLKVRNTLLTTILFYDVLLASQGIRAVEWQELVDSDPLYAWMFYREFDKYSGIKVQMRTGNGWSDIAKIDDVGPLTWKTIAIPIDYEKLGTNFLNTVEFRISFFSDNFMIDRIALGYAGKSLPEVLESHLLKPKKVINENGEPCPEIIHVLEKTDDSYLITQPSDSYTLEYSIPPGNGQDVSVFIYSNGYYHEWIRAAWLKGHSNSYRFSLLDGESVINALKSSWKRNRFPLEKEFFNQRIPLRNEKIQRSILH